MYMFPEGMLLYFPEAGRGYICIHHPAEQGVYAYIPTKNDMYMYMYAPQGIYVY